MLGLWHHDVCGFGSWTHLLIPFMHGTPWFMTWLLYVDGNIFKILHTKFIFREIIVGSRTVACELQTKTGSVGI
jgi:hypothetical protein